MQNKIRLLFIELIKNFFSLSHKELTTQLVFISKCLATIVVSYQMYPFLRKVPYMDFLANFGSDNFYNYTLHGATLLGAFLILFTKKIRSGSFLVGSAFLLSIISCRPSLSVAHLYFAVTLLVISFSNKNVGNLFLKIQLLILYCFATINKVVLEDWWNGKYFETLMVDRYANTLYIDAAHFFQPMMLSKMMGITTMCLEFFIPIAFLFKRLNKIGVIIGLIFHTLLILITHHTFGPFYFIIVFSYFIFFDWPQKLIIYSPANILGNKITGLLPHIHFKSSDKNYSIEIADSKKNYTGYTGILVLLLNTPIFFYLFVLLTSRFDAVNCILILHFMLIPFYWRTITNR